MKYGNFLIRQKRMEKNWSQEGLCKGICTASYLSKIEQGKAEPSDEVLELLLSRMGVAWNRDENDCDGQMVEDAYEYLLSGDREKLAELVRDPAWKQYENSSWGLDYYLLNQYGLMHLDPVDDSLEGCMDHRQLALQRNLQGRWEEALSLYPCSFLYESAGSRCYRDGNVTKAMELLQAANELACQEGSVQIMLSARITMGSCFSNLQDYNSMFTHYKAAKRLACALGAADVVEDISYNIAATQIELGQYRQALDYFEHHQNRDAMRQHKLAICYEKLGYTQKALDAINEACSLEHTLPEHAAEKICRVVQLRLSDVHYLDSEEYGNALLDCFETCKKHLAAGYCIFHMPWMLEWFEHHRQYKRAYELLRDFPEYRQKG